MFYYYGIDWTYIVLVLPAVIFSLIASANVNSTFKKYSRVYNSRRLTGADAARRILDSNGLQHIRIERISGNLSDHFDPRSNVIRLSQAVYDGATAAAVGVAAHECGHAIQHAVGYLPIKLRSAIIPITNIGSKLAFPMILLGIVLTAWSQQALVIAYIGVALFGLSLVFQLVTLPTEFNASRRALKTIDNMGLLSGDDLKASKKVLTAAAMTYVAALAVTLMQLIRLFLMVNRNRRN
ncbi:MAG: zinc metallopeptidase [Acutalibacteraceae bacterium]|nr:zinc metallopeptidase [Acutalibacteraceae bacterium]